MAREVTLPSGVVRWQGTAGSGTDRVRKNFRTQAEAEDWEDSEAKKQAPQALAVVAPLLPPQAGPSGCSWTLEEGFKETFRIRWKGKSCEKMVKCNIGFAYTFFGKDTLLEDIVQGTWIVDYREHLLESVGNHTTTVNRKLTTLGTIFETAKEYAGLTRKPKLLLYDELPRISFFSDAEEAVMLAKAKELGLQEIHDLIVLGIDTGFRRGEMLRLTVSHYHDGKFLLHADETKGKAARSIKCTDRVKAIVQHCIDEGRLYLLNGISADVVEIRWRKLATALGREGDHTFIPHVLRHTCATRLVDSGVPLPVVQKWMGHKNIKTTMRYTHLLDDQIDAASDALQRRNATRQAGLKTVVPMVRKAA